MSSSESVIVCTLGRVAYRPTWALQEAIKNRLLQAKKIQQPIPHVLLLLEHSPVFTMGKSGDNMHLLATGDAEVVHIDRGGDVTYHGPGQLVVYFLLDLDRFYRDLHRFMRDMEEVVIRTLAEYDIIGFRVSGRTGVWVGATGSERKICAFGIHTSRWVTTHGLALNIDPDLSYFHRITPCGITDRGVTSLVQELQISLKINEVSNPIIKHFDAVFGAHSKVLSSTDSYAYLEDLTNQINLKDTLCV